MVLDSGSNIDKPSDLQVHNNDLYVVSQDANEVLIFRDVTTLASGDPPDVVLSNFDRPVGLAVTNGALYVGDDDPEVLVFNNPASLVTGDTADVTLSSGGSMLEEVRRVFVFDNVLYVTSGGNDDTDRLTAFSPANGLTNGQAPDFILSESSGMDSPISATVVGGRLWVSNRSGDQGVVGFDNPTGLFTGALPDVSLYESNFTEDVEELESAGGMLWGVDETLDYIFGYFNPAGMQSAQIPDIGLFDLRMEDGSLRSLKVVQR